MNNNIKKLKNDEKKIKAEIKKAEENTSEVFNEISIKVDAFFDDLKIYIKKEEIKFFDKYGRPIETTILSTFLLGILSLSYPEEKVEKVKKLKKILNNIENKIITFHTEVLNIDDIETKLIEVINKNADFESLDFDADILLISTKKILRKISFLEIGLDTKQSLENNKDFENIIKPLDEKHDNIIKILNETSHEFSNNLIGNRNNIYKNIKKEIKSMET